MRLRLATPADADAIGALHRHTMRVSLPFLPQLHTLAEVIDYAGREILPNNTVWVAEIDDRIAGYIAFAPGWINQLYVLPEHQGAGLGPALLAKALADRQPRRLWTFQKNARARRFYEARGFALIELTDGSGNEEHEPDALYAWRPPA
jgi:GNAT superfamily N-acetyltransferase